MSALLRRGHAREVLAEQAVHVPHLVDAEIAHALRGQVLRGVLEPELARRVLRVWQRLAVTRHPCAALLGRVWELHSNVSAYDATYVALAEALGCALLTADSRLARAPGPRCPMTVVPS